MVIRALNRKLIRDFLNLRVQTFTTALLVISGVSLLVSTWGAHTSLRKSRDLYYQQNHFADLFVEFKRAPVELLSRVKKLSEVERAEGRIVIEGLIHAKDQEEPAVGRFISLPNSELQLNQIYLRQGRLPLFSQQIEVLVHEGFASAHHLQPGDEFEVLIQGQKEKVRVSGIGLSPEYVYALSPAAPMPDDKHFGIFWMPEEHLQRLSKMSDSINSLVLTVQPGASLLHLQYEVDRLTKPYGSLGAYTREHQPSNSLITDEIRQQRTQAILSPFIFLSVAAFLIHVISSRLIATHRPQIATLKALGYSQSEIALHYLKLIFCMMMAGVVPGLILGGALGKYFSNVYKDYFRFPHLDFSLTLDSFVIGSLAGILPGLLGAWSSILKAARLPPAEAMRPPSPPSYHSTLLEKWKARQKIRPLDLIVWRNLFFRPWRLVLSILGMSAAVAILVVSNSWNDVVRYLLDTQFQIVQREDLSLNLIKPLPSSALQEISKFKGVLRVEGYRFLPVRVHYLNHKKEIDLTGWPEGSLMRRPLDRDLKKIPLPAEGVLLSRYFREQWGMSAGEYVEIETLEGEPRQFRLKVSGFSNDLVGVHASMRIQELWKLLDEQADYNFATLQTDPHELNSLYVKLSEIPFVIAVNLKTSLYRGFLESFGRVVQMTTTILVSFALSIALAIIYNSVRVSFSERAWELASLRVLGFESSTVFYLLFREVSTLVFLSLLPGCLLGFGLTAFTMNMIHTEMFNFPTVVEASTYAGAMLVILVALAVSSWMVKRMIGRLNLAEALKARE